MEKRKKVAALTLGCKVNLYDTEAMLELFVKNGYESVDFQEAADVYIVNTCTVTNFGDKKSRQMLRKARKQNPAALVVATGCYAQVAPGEVMQIPGVDLVVGTSDRNRIVEIVHSHGASERAVSHVSDIMAERDFENLEIERLSERTRAYLKIQEGCDRFCTYCIIPYARGPVRSRQPEDVLNEVRKLAANGYKEIVLTGIHVASYGKDLKTTGLLDIIRSVHDCDGIERIRFSSVEPTVITDNFLEGLAALPKVCDHFHLSLQSGSARTLKRMNRRYTPEEYADAVFRLRKAMPDVAVTTDVIVGFPGESEQDFKDSMDFIRETALSRLHVFPYSPKKGTKAAEFENQLPKAVKDERQKMMADLGSKLRKQYVAGFEGKTLKVLYERHVGDNIYEGHSTNYITVRGFSDNCIENEIYPSKILKIEGFTGIAASFS